MSECGKIDDGGAAFPGMASDGHRDYRPGLTKRDYFAAAALTGLLANSEAVHAGGLRFERREIDPEARQLLAEMVVNVAANAAAFLFLNIDEPRHQLTQALLGEFAFLDLGSEVVCDDEKLGCAFGDHLFENVASGPEFVFGKLPPLDLLLRFGVEPRVVHRNRRVCRQPDYHSFMAFAEDADLRVSEK